MTRTCEPSSRRVFRACLWPYLEAPAPDGHLAADHNVAFLRLSQAYEAEATRAEEIGWSVSRASMDHLAMITQPDKVAAMIVDVTAAVLVNG